MDILHRLFGSSPSGILNASDVGHPVFDSSEPFEGELHLDEKFEYDVIIVGGGTAGCCIASRLSEDPNIRVLLLEAGGSGRRNPLIRIPAMFVDTWRTKVDYNLWTVPQTEALDRSLYWPRGKVLGGCSSINAMMFHVGVPSDYDEWASILKGEPGAEDWSYKNFHQYFQKFEKFVPNPSRPLVDHSPHGLSGHVSTGFYGYLGVVNNNFIKSCDAIGIPYREDLNNPNESLGVGKIMNYISPDGERASTEAAYLTPEVLKRPNLKVVVHAHVTKLLISVKGNEKRVVGVEFAPEGMPAQRYRVKSKKEVVLTAGAVHSPQILLLSGIGPPSPSTIHPLPGIGMHLYDHPQVHTMFRVRRGAGSMSELVSRNSLNGILQAVAALAHWTVTGAGYLTSQGAEAAAFVQSTDRTLFPTTAIANGQGHAYLPPDRPDIELWGLPMGFPHHGAGPIPKGDLMTISGVLLRPTSTGTITLKSHDPFEPPVIDPKYLSTQHDVDVLVKTIRLMWRVAKTEPLASMLEHDDDPLLDHIRDDVTDADIADLLRERVETVYHPTSTVRMAPLSKGGCVNAYLQVYGIPNLRVADASIMPTIISGHTTAPVIAIAEKAADMIKASLSSLV